MIARQSAETVHDRDRRARFAAQTVFDAPFVLQAGAGTGKTAVLVARIVAWSLGPGWERARGDEEARRAQSGRRGAVEDAEVAAAVLDGVVAITFTEAATAEIASRVSQELRKLADGDCDDRIDERALPDDPVVRMERVRALLGALDHLAVSTIHGFCRRILAGYPLEARLHPRFVVDADERLLAQTVQDVVEERLRTALSDPVDQNFLFLAAAGVGPQDIAEAAGILVSRGVSAEELRVDPFCDARVAALSGRVARAVARLRDLLAPRVAAMRGVRLPGEIASALATLAAILEAGGVCSPDTIAESLASHFPSNLSDRLASWGKGKFGAKEASALGDVAEEIAAAAAEFGRLARHVSSLDLERTTRARRVLAPVIDEVTSRMRSKGAVTYQGLLRNARDLLRASPLVARRIRSEITQLLVDEFQDTDPVQCDILRSLALEGDPATRPALFLVGDPKQSIYGWRSADLAAYERFVGDVIGMGGRREDLDVNFRSVPAVLSEVTRCVAPVMIEEAAVQPRFEELAAGPELENSGGFRLGRWTPVECWVAWARNDGRKRWGENTLRAVGDEIEARALAADLRALHDEGNVAWREIGVLLRTTSALDTYLQELRSAGIPFAVERDRSYYQRREVIDTVALVRTIFDPADHLALVTWLRSAVVGVPDAALVPLWAGKLPDLMTDLTGWDERILADLRALAAATAAAVGRDVPGIDRVRGWENSLVAALERMALLRDSLQKDSAVVFVEKVRTASLIEVTEAARTLGPFRAANLDRLFRVLLEAMESTASEHEEILRTLRRNVSLGLEGEEKRPRGVTEDAVRVMTVHGAKGLDFGHVYLMEVHKGSARDKAKLVDVDEEADGIEFSLFGAATPGWDLVERRRSRTQDAELVRTLYVAMTRAKQRLVVSGVRRAQLGLGRSVSYADLLAARTDTPDLATMFLELEVGGRDGREIAGVQWRFPALATSGDASARPRAAAVTLPPMRRVEADAVRLSMLRSGAAARMLRPIFATATGEAHRARTDFPGEGTFAEESATAGGSLFRNDVAVPTAATAVGSAIHMALESIDLAGDLDHELTRARELLPSYLQVVATAEHRAAALERAQLVLDRFAVSSLFARFRQIAPFVLARELPVLTSPVEGPGAPVGFVSGAIDLVYRDRATGDLVIADYKTDDVATREEAAERARGYELQGAAYARALREALQLAAAPRLELWFLQADLVVGMSPSG